MNVVLRDRLSVLKTLILVIYRPKLIMTLIHVLMDYHETVIVTKNELFYRYKNSEPAK